MICTVFGQPNLFFLYVYQRRDHRHNRRGRFSFFRVSFGFCVTGMFRGGGENGVSEFAREVSQWALIFSQWDACFMVVVGVSCSWGRSRSYFLFLS